MDIQTGYQKAIVFAATKHGKQTIPGTTLPYVVHLSNVAMEILLAALQSKDFDVAFAVQVALLHDVLEDTNTPFEELAQHFSPEIALAVAALTKNDKLPKAQKMQDSLDRIKQQPKEVGAVKLADRITNLQAPPQHWSREKKQEYLQEAAIILQNLHGCNTYLEERIASKIVEYQHYIG